MTTHDAPIFVPRPRLVRILRILVAVGVLGALGLSRSSAQTLAGFLLAAIYFLGIALGAVVFLALHYVTGAQWSRTLRRIPESIAGTLPRISIIVALILLVSFHTLYPWAQTGAEGAQSADPSLRSWWTPAFFLVRMATYLVTWILLARAVVRRGKLSPLFLVVFAITFSLASFDWLMSLQARWFSTIFAIYHFAGMFEASIAAIALAVIILRQRGYLAEIVTEDHLHDLGRYLFAFATFWAYIWFCQYMLIWYSNLPAETSYYLGRTSSPWAPLTILSLLLNWMIPFFVLLPSRSKGSAGVLGRMCVVVLLGHWIDLFSLVLPPFMGHAPRLDMWIVGATVAIGAWFALSFIRSLKQSPLV